MLNPTENAWEYRRKNNLALRVRDDYDAIVEASCTAWNNLSHLNIQSAAEFLAYRRIGENSGHVQCPTNLVLRPTN